MLEVKLFEVRDRATFIPTIAIQIERRWRAMLTQEQTAEDYLIGAAGYGKDNPLVLFGYLEGGTMRYDPFQWGGGRTMLEAHRYIEANWKNLRSGDVIDVEFILGETEDAKISERLGG